MLCNISSQQILFNDIILFICFDFLFCIFFKINNGKKYPLPVSVMLSYIAHRNITLSGIYDQLIVRYENIIVLSRQKHKINSPCHFNNLSNLLCSPQNKKKSIQYNHFDFLQPVRNNVVSGRNQRDLRIHSINRNQSSNQLADDSTCQLSL